MELQWPLILFSTLLAWAAGLFAAQCVWALRGKGARAQMPALITSAVLLVVGGIAEFFHLEHWERIFNGFGHMTSGITQELIAIVVLAVVANRPKDYNFDQPAARVTVDTVMTDFKNDAANASEKYSDKVIAVTGQVGTIQDEYVTLRAYDDDLWLYNVNVYMENNQDLKKFKVGDTVTIEGVCDDTDLFGDEDVKKCVIADQFASVPDYDGAQKVKINDFVKRYKENQVKADEKYKGKTVQFTAKVSLVADEYAVGELSNADVWDWDCDVQICFEDMDDLKKVTEGKTVTIVGECYGQADM